MLTAVFEQIGKLVLNLGESFQFLLAGRVDWKKVISHTASIGFDSLPVVLVICVISGSVLALQTADKFAMTGADSYVGGLVSIAIVRELAPIFSCLAVGARSGTAIAAEIANMKVTDQVSALQILHISPIRYLMAPRLLACMLCLPMLTALGAFVGIIGGMIVSQQVSHLHHIKYLDSIWLMLAPYDIEVSLIKALIFGVILASVCCTIGLNTRGGARDVGLSTTYAAVWTAVSIIVTDFFLTWIFFGTTYGDSH